MKFERVIWDFNGTLLDDLEACFRCVNALLSKYSAEHGCRPFADYGEYRRTFGFPIQEYYRRAGFDFDKTPYDVLAVEFMEMYYEKEPFCPLSDGVFETIAELKKRGVRQVVLSASRREFLLTQLEKRGVLPYFDEVLGISDIYAASKLHVAREWIASSGVDSSKMVMVGDTLHDAETAEELGCPCVLYSGGHQSLDDYDGIVIDKINKVLELLV